MDMSFKSINLCNLINKDFFFYFLRNVDDFCLPIIFQTLELVLFVAFSVTSVFQPIHSTIFFRCIKERRRGGLFLLSCGNQKLTDCTLDIYETYSSSPKMT